MQNPIRNTGCLPKIPERINQVKNCSVLLTDRSKNDWKFLFEELKDIPSAFSNGQDYDFSAIEESRWQNVVVPASLVLQGFSIQNNIEYYYKRTITVPKDYCDKSVFLRFEGVYSNARVWVNNRFCATHIGGFTVWNVDITEFAGNGEITLVVGVADMEGNRKSPWNPNGDYQSNSAWASYYAHHNIGGILRDITMFCLPQQAVLQTHIDTHLHGDTAEAKINVTFSEPCAGLTLFAEITENGESKISKELPIEAQHLSFSLEVEGAKLWDAEHPNLYVLHTVLYDENHVLLQENTTKFGFREITYGGKNGTDKNRIYVNGKEIKLRGVCRHDVSRIYGRSLTKEDIYCEIETYKAHNINHIRTSHYPASEYMLSVCDELGMYVEQENAACFKGANGFDIYNPPEDFLRSFQEMVEASRNHPSVLIWSIANESGFEKSSGFRNCYDYIKQTDSTRPVIFSYPWTVKSKPLPYDIFSKHYEKVTSKLGKSELPILHDEFAHVPCYNIADLAYDNSSRVFWGESIKRGWDNIFDTPGALGCDIWAAIDDVFYLPEKSMERHQSHLKGECAGYGEWGCIFDAFKRLKPEAYLTKKAFTPIKINRTDIHGNQIRLELQNRFDHTNLNEGYVTVKDKNENVLYSGKIQENVVPHSIGTVSVAPSRCTDNIRVEFSFDSRVVESLILNKTYAPFEIESSAIHVEYAQNGIRICGADGTAATVKSMHLYTGLNKFEVLYRDIAKIKDNTYLADFGFGRAFLLTVCKVGNILHFKVHPKNILSSLYLIGELGVDIETEDDVQSVSWIRKSLYSDYPDTHIARDCGTAYKTGIAHNYEDTDMQNVPWEQDMSAFAYYEKASRYNHIASNDFRTKRLRISSYLAYSADGKAVLVQTDSDNINAYANPMQSKLQIGKGYYKRSILWGNYWGQRFRLRRQSNFEFSLSLKDAF